jgi:iron complex transport system ATP-binding protein
VRTESSENTKDPGVRKIVEAEGVSLRFGDRDVLRDVSFALAQGDFAALLGPNGAGKTTLLRLLVRELTPNRGEIRLYGRALKRYRPKEIARRVAMVPQENPILFPYTVGEVVLMGRYPHMGRFSLGGPEHLKKAAEAMDQTDTRRFQNRLIGELSGGERQRTILARALAQDAPVLLLDEPTSFLDIRHRLEFYGYLREINEKMERTILVVSHDINLACQFCNTALLLVEGRMIARGRPAEVIRPDILEEVFRVRASVEEHPATGAPFVVFSRPTA